ncbi:MAG: hydroxylaminobenzene mutase [Bacteroidota bacterium]
MTALTPTGRRLLIHGTVLFLLGLLNGFLVPYLPNPRMGLSAHLAGVQDALVLWAFGLMWAHVQLDGWMERTAYGTALLGMYGLWVGLLLSAILGTSEAAPIAGAGFTGTPMEELVTNTIIVVSALASVVATVLVLIGLVRGKT